MRISTSLRSISLGVATASFLLVGSALAQPAHSSQMNQPTAQSQQWQMNGVNARLSHALDAQSAHVGEVVELRLDRTVKTAGGAKLPGGTVVFGEVERVQASQGKGPSSMTLRFTSAELKNGQKIPVKVTVIGAFPAGARSNYLDDMSDELPPAPRHINPMEKYTQEPGLLSHIQMTSAVQARNSGTFTDRDGNVKLNAGTYLQLAIAPQTITSGQQRSAM